MTEQSISQPDQMTAVAGPDSEEGGIVYLDSDTVFHAVLDRVKSRQPDLDLEPLHKAYRFASLQHAGQHRLSGEPYVTHPVQVASILADLDMDVPTLIAGLLHDVAEDCNVNLDEIRGEFGDEVAYLVDGVTKLHLIEPGAERNIDEQQSPDYTDRRRRQQEINRQANNLRKIFLAMASDLRVMVIKLADRLHNMQTLDVMPEAKRSKIAMETLQIYAPLAHRLGIWQMKWPLEDLAFKYLEPERYAEVAARVAATRGERQAEVDEAIEILEKRLRAENIDALIQGRPKHLYSIYQKMLKQELDFSEIYDLVALRIIVHTRPECYQVLGIVSAIWQPLQGMYSDYIARPKSNMYQSLHLKVVGARNRPLEIQIRTWEMHRMADFGVAAHWQYKEGSKTKDQFEQKLAWLRQQLFDWETDNRDSVEFLRSVTEDLFADQVFVFSPRGDVFDFPAGATPIDFAYRIHSDVGNHCVGAKINGKMVALSTHFKNGDVVDIITRANSNPSLDWLALAKTSHARSKIKSYFRRLNLAETIAHGRTMLEKEIERLGILLADLLKEESLRNVASHFNVSTEEELLAAIGYGTVAPTAVINRLRPSDTGPSKQLTISDARSDESKLKVLAGGVDNVMFRRSRCCMPIPGDDIVGYVTRGRGMALHRRECPNAQRALSNERERIVPIDFSGGEGQVYGIQLIIISMDRTGLLGDIGAVFGEMKTNITAIRTQSHRDHTATLNVTAEVADMEHLSRLLAGVRRLSDVLDVQRVLVGREDRP